MVRYAQKCIIFYRIPCFFAVCLATFCLIMVNITYFQQRSSRDNQTMFNNRFQIDYNEKGKNLLQSNELIHYKIKNKLILLWSPMFSEFSELQVGKDSFRILGCSVHNCEITDNRSRLLESDAVLFHVRTMSVADIPRFRNPRQKWIFFSMEAPPYSFFPGFEFMYNMFNWTMTYREDSDIVVRYGTVSRSLKNRINTSSLYVEWKRKNKMATWMVSHCSTFGNREKYVQMLRKYVDVDTYGLCGIATCTYNETEKCLENFSRRYFFYLAFENSICDGYITEKFFRVLKYGLIPVVFGGGDYERIAPPNSYINVMDFKSPRELSSHLYEVASNFTLYSKYFNWRLEGYDVNAAFKYCDLCKIMSSVSFHNKSTYCNIIKWWVSNSNCRKWNIPTNDNTKRFVNI